MDVFSLRNSVVGDYADYIRSFINIADARISLYVAEEMRRGLLWPEPLLQLNLNFESGKGIQDLIKEGTLHPLCRDIFRDKDKYGEGPLLNLHLHQTEAIYAANASDNYVLTTGTGSGKSLAYIVPIVDHVLASGQRQRHPGDRRLPDERAGQQPGGRAREVPEPGFPRRPPVTFRRYTGQERRRARRDHRQPAGHPADQLRDAGADPDPAERAARSSTPPGSLRFLVLDELHTYRGRQGADVAMLVRRVRERCDASNLQCVGTSATLAGARHAWTSSSAQIAEVASGCLATTVKPEHVIGETLRRVPP